MKRFCVLLFLILCIRWWCSQQIAAAAPVEQSSEFDFSSIPLSQVVSLYFKEVARGPYVVCNDVLADNRIVSIRAAGKTLDKAVLGPLLETYGLEARTENGLTVVCKRTAAAIVDDAVFVYRPIHRDAAYLVEFLSHLVKGTFANRRSAVSSMAVGGAPASPVGQNQSQPVPQVSSFKPAQGDDFIIYVGSQADIEKLQKLLAQVDVPTGEVLVKGYIYEVGKNDADASALDVFVSVLGGKISALASAPTLANSLRLKTASLDVIASMLRSDGRFRVVTSPYTRVRSGGTARFVVGSEVPVLGAIVTTQNGSSQQSVEYRSSGTIFEVSPKVRDRTTDLDLFQQVSSFVSTDTGVNGSPTLNKRELKTSLTVEDGEILVIGGLNDAKEDEARSGLSFLPFSLSRSRASRSSELLLVLELKRI